MGKATENGAGGGDGRDLAHEYARQSDMIHHMLDMVCTCESGVITFVNATGLDMLGADEASQLIGRPIANFVSKDYQELFHGELRDIAEEKRPVPVKFTRFDGEDIDVEVNVTLFEGGEDADSVMVEIRNVTDRVRAASKLREREERLRGIVDTVAEAIITIDEAGSIQSFNLAAERIFGYAQSEVLGENVKILMPSPHQEQHDQYLKDYLGGGAPKIIGVAGREEFGLRKDGSTFPLELSVTELRTGKHRLFTGILRDNTRRKRDEEALKAAHDELEARVEERTAKLTREIHERQRVEQDLRLAANVIANLNEAVVICDSNFLVKSINPAFAEISGYSIDEIVGRPPPFVKILREDTELHETMLVALASVGRWETEFWNKRKNGEEYAEHLSLTAIEADDGIHHEYAAVISDITKRKQDEERIRYQANFDALTGLPNRALFTDRLAHSLAAMSRSGSKLGLMFMDLDGFKLVNDTLGHDVGDLLLQETSKRLGKCVRDDDTVARLGGDEFTVIMPNLHDARDAPIVAQRILDSLTQPFNLRGQEAFVSASIGITIFPDDARDSSELLKNADTAMYRAKEQGKANYQFFTNDLNQEVKERLILKNGLNKAMERNEFDVFYQPKLDLRTGRIMGAEALLRWNNKDLGMVSPAKFIPIMEETGFVAEVGEWVLRTACAQHLEWIAAGLPPIRIAVNLSARQLRDAGFVDMVKEVLELSSVPPMGLEIEITESMLMSDAPNIVKALNDLHDIGIHVAMDDFGTGYSSLSYLKRFPIDTIKIDRSFVADIATSSDDAEIIRTIINMGQTLQRRVVAEGVETVEQINLLTEYECDEIQGYFFSRPLPSDAITLFLKEHAAKAAASAS